MVQTIYFLYFAVLLVVKSQCKTVFKFRINSNRHNTRLSTRAILRIAKRPDNQSYAKQTEPVLQSELRSKHKDEICYTYSLFVDSIMQTNA